MIDKIRKDMLQARKNKDSRKLTILSTFLGEAEKIGKDKGNRATTDSEVISVLKKFINNIKENMRIIKDVAQYIPGEKDEDEVEIKGYEFEISVLEEYLPNQLSELELAVVIKDIVSELTEKNPKMMGKVMSELKDKHAGLYDGKIASKIVKSELI